MQALLKKITLILIGLAMIIGATLVSPALHEIGLSYPDADPALLPLLVTLPSLTLLLGLVISSVLSSKVAAKPLILLGLLLILVSGVLPAFLHDLTHLWRGDGDDHAATDDAVRPVSREGTLCAHRLQFRCQLRHRRLLYRAGRQIGAQ